ncbi:MAG: bifunctional DNA-formamidopyrimidine glycosylase/DNA-(apurinic or apyrimidinic site) lyase [Propionibacteriaceae bacterium]|jgi:formamidopyrimidine-DNA glycosylase|nr:bifunctional DNA-formamidopyrimidine glycosylase/DNA-(apurinic or apyrimidinic site) lyase [Propionibacteriaceae bacterium]
MPELPEVETVRRGLERLLVSRRLTELVVREAKSWQIDPVLLEADPAPAATAGAISDQAPPPTPDPGSISDPAPPSAPTAEPVPDAAPPSAPSSGSIPDSVPPSAPARPPAPPLSLDQAWLQARDRHLIGARVAGARRRAKVLILDLDNGNSLVCHLKMTGQMVVRGDEDWGAGHPTDSLLARLPDRSTRLEFGFEADWRLFFNDQRKFGWVRLMPTAAVEQLSFIASLGPEPFDPDGFAEFQRRIARHGRTSVKAALLDQSVVAGIGNIYADESLWAGRVHPARPVAQVSDAKLRQLWRAAAEVMRLSIELGGSTDRNYVDAEGKRGSYLGFANVFRREGQPCPRCGATIVKTRVAGRGTHLCPHCQRL